MKGQSVRRAVGTKGSRYEQSVFVSEILRAQNSVKIMQIRERHEEAAPTHLVFLWVCRGRLPCSRINTANPKDLLYSRLPRLSFRSNLEVVGSIPTEVKRFFLCLVWFPDSLYMGSVSIWIYTSGLILCSTICVPSATRHNIHMYPYFLFEKRATSLVLLAAVIWVFSSRGITLRSPTSFTRSNSKEETVCLVAKWSGLKKLTAAIVRVHKWKFWQMKTTDNGNQR